MTDQTVAPREVNVTEAEGCVAALVDEVAGGKGRVILQRDGKPVAALISAADLERLEHMERQRTERYKIVQEIQARFSHMDPEEVERDVAEAIAEMRAEARAERAAMSHT
jgi:prevent-host-death family protein